MPFNASERSALLALKGVGPTVVRRLEEAGFERLDQLADCEAETLTRMIGEMLHSRCWQNSPMALASMRAVVSLAKAHTDARQRK